MDTSTHDGPAEHPTAADALAAIDAQQQRTTTALRPSPLGMFLPWGLGYLVGFGGVWLAIRGVLPDAVVTVLLVVAAIVPLASTGITVARSTHGLAGPTKRIGALYGWAWLLGFAALFAINIRVGFLGVPGPTLSLIWSGSALLVVGLLYLAGGALWNHVPQYVLGVWTLATGVLSVFVGYPANFAVLALAGGGGFIVLGLWLHAKSRR
ncbi:hypothetical protein LQ327_02300 [Actinomycetospora endophytica]|uniref:Transporter n=1 Tax=Actinomycetospora endophytica TaxID=2291215 RepID=A0ABS8P1U6_9PSEU|nr:hypothetical protein [Actinomycetospora endophytica]MCD2192226.1 hypothetical protein [Actinomycetospora endophytica]